MHLGQKEMHLKHGNEAPLTDFLQENSQLITWIRV